MCRIPLRQMITSRLTKTTRTASETRHQGAKTFWERSGSPTKAGLITGRQSRPLLHPTVGILIPLLCCTRRSDIKKTASSGGEYLTIELLPCVNHWSDHCYSFSRYAILKHAKMYERTSRLPWPIQFSYCKAAGLVQLIMISKDLQSKEGETLAACRATWVRKLKGRVGSQVRKTAFAPLLPYGSRAYCRIAEPETWVVNWAQALIPAGLRQRVSSRRETCSEVSPATDHLHSAASSASQHCLPSELCREPARCRSCVNHRRPLPTLSLSPRSPLSSRATSAL